MRVLVIGNGGREHALCWRLAQSPSVTALAALPGNPGTAQLAGNLDGAAANLDGVVAAALDWRADLVLIGPEDPLVRGLANRLRAAGVATFGPDQAAAQIEGSKVFAKELFRAAGVPTAAFDCFDTAAEAKAYLRQRGAPIVVKADGLCAGKGAIMCATIEQAERAVDDLLVARSMGEAGARVVIEECLSGPELSVFALVDGPGVKVLAAAQDHKRALDGDRGPNTGGMGAYSPVPQFGLEVIDEIRRTCLEPTARALAERGMPYRGVLFGGFMLTEHGPMTLEYNCRFGDPETQAIMPRLLGDFGQVCAAVAEGRLDEVEVRVTDTAAVCVVVTSGGYPGSYPTGLPVSGLDKVAADPDVVVFQAGTKEVEGRLVTAGGRVLGVTGLGQSVAAAAQRAYGALDLIGFDGAAYRSDIAWQAR